MCRDLLPDIADILDEGEDFKKAGRDGRGIQMGVWAGGRLEARPLAAMGGNTSLSMGPIKTFGTLWIDENGFRFCNEGFGDPIFSGFPGAYLKPGTNIAVFDSSILEDMQYSPPSHATFWVGDSGFSIPLQ